MTATRLPVPAVHPPSVLRAMERGARVYRRLWRGSVFTAFVGPGLVLGAMGLGLGGLVDEGGGTVEGLSYLEFVAPGLLAGTVMQNAAADSLWSILAGMKWMRFFHGMAATPLSPADIATGGLLFLGVRLGLSAAAFLLVAALLGGVVSFWGVLALPLAVVTGLVFAAPIAAFSATQETDGRFPLVMRFAIQPLFLFSGTFFPVGQLPGWLQDLAWLSPLWHGVELCRAATTGRWAELGPGMIAAHGAVLVAVLLAGWWAVCASYTRRLTP